MSRGQGSFLGPFFDAHQHASAANGTHSQNSCLACLEIFTLSNLRNPERTAKVALDAFKEAMDNIYSIDGFKAFFTEMYVLMIFSNKCCVLLPRGFNYVLRFLQKLFPESCTSCFGIHA